MGKATIKDLRRFAKRSIEVWNAFSAPLYADDAGPDTIASLPWGKQVDLLERRGGRSRIEVDAQIGFVENKYLVQEMRVARRQSGGTSYFTTPLFRKSSGSAKHFDLLWGDIVHVLTPGPSRTYVRARNQNGYVQTSHLTEEALLEVFFIDVGQGDGVLIRTPEGKHLLIDGGYSRRKQPTGKSAADFVDWKFFKDYAQTRVALDVMIASHCDNDHYGGLSDLLDVSQFRSDEMDTEGTDVGAFYHAGVSWWRPGERYLGPKKSGHLVRLLGARADAVGVVNPSTPKAERLQGEWGDFIEQVVGATGEIERIEAREGDPRSFLPGFAPEDSDALTIKVLAPVTRLISGEPAVQDLGDDSQNTNGHSVLLRIDYRGARVLLTGDLNKKSMRALLDAYQGRHAEFSCDVAKGCHHGSDDVSYAFLQAMRPAATIISSGDNEGHAHPRPTIMAASALTGHVEIDAINDELITPVVYSTEVERSVAIGRVTRIEAPAYPLGDEDSHDVRLYAREARFLEEEFRDDATSKEDIASRLFFEETSSGALSASRKARKLAGSYVVSGVTYGLVNVRTDGKTIMCATRKESGNSWTVHSFPARFGS